MEGTVRKSDHHTVEEISQKIEGLKDKNQNRKSKRTRKIYAKTSCNAQESRNEQRKVKCPPWEDDEYRNKNTEESWREPG